MEHFLKLAEQEKTFDAIIAALKKVQDTMKEFADRLAAFEKALDTEHRPVISAHDIAIQEISESAAQAQAGLENLRGELHALRTETHRGFVTVQNGLSRITDRESTCGLTVDRIESIMTRTFVKLEDSKKSRDEFLKKIEAQRRIGVDGGTADTSDLKSDALVRAGSSPARPTTEESDDPSGPSQSELDLFSQEQSASGEQSAPSRTVEVLRVPPESTAPEERK